MTEPVFFVVERRPIGETPAIYHERLPSDLTRKPLKDSLNRPIIIRDLKGQPIELNPIIYGVRLDRLPNAADLIGLSLDRLYRMYLSLKASGTLPASNLADPPKAKGEQGILHGEQYVVRNPPWHDQPRPSFLVAQYCPSCRDYIMPGRHLPDCPTHIEDATINRDQPTPLARPIRRVPRH